MVGTDHQGNPRDHECRGKTCPSVYETEGGDYIVQGALLASGHRAELAIPAGEDAVRVPGALLKQLAARIRA
ncbi:MAG: hypothetical protein IT436_15990 [Phycisphaerales bacterium]|nr:hypothetical protein [Phycisphaerales bacterium]